MTVPQEPLGWRASDAFPWETALHAACAMPPERTPGRSRPTSPSLDLTRVCLVRFALCPCAVMSLRRQCSSLLSLVSASSQSLNLRAVLEPTARGPSSPGRLILVGVFSPF